MAPGTVSIAQGLERAGATVRVAAGPAGLTGCDGVVLPGVGATAAAMERLRSARMVEPLRGWDGPLLGICVGLQLLFERSDEDGADCLGILPGEVRRQGDGSHIGWNDIVVEKLIHCSMDCPTGPSATSSTATPRCPTTRRWWSPLRSTARHSWPPCGGVRCAVSSSIPSGAPPPVSGSWPTSSTQSVLASREGNGRALTNGGVMLRTRVMPCLDVAGGRVVKGSTSSIWWTRVTCRVGRPLHRRGR